MIIGRNALTGRFKEVAYSKRHKARYIVENINKTGAKWKHRRAKEEDNDFLIW